MRKKGRELRRKDSRWGKWREGGPRGVGEEESQGRESGTREGEEREKEREGRGCKTPFKEATDCSHTFPPTLQPAFSPLSTLLSSWHQLPFAW